MRIVIAPSGSRGDFQPLLALAVGLRAAQHDVLLLCSPNFAVEAQAFGVPVHNIGIDIEAQIRDIGFEASPVRGAYTLFKIGRQMVVQVIDQMLPLCQGADLIIGAGAQVAAPTVADTLGIPYLFVAYTPQAIRSAEHPPFTFPLQRLPRLVNRLLWRLMAFSVGMVFSGPVNAKRRALGLPLVRDWYDHFFPVDRLVIAADPELAPLPGDAGLAHPPLGALHLDDNRPLAPELERFLDAGPAPVYIGFGSMPDKAPAVTSRLLVEAARKAGVRLVLSSGWARYGGGDIVSSDGVQVIGPSSHTLLFPRVAAVVHHGGAGTTSAALRAGRPQVVVPHVFDQFQWARWVADAGLGPVPIPRSRLTVDRLAEALTQARAPHFGERAAQLAQQTRKHDPIASMLRVIEAAIRTR